MSLDDLEEKTKSLLRYQGNDDEIDVILENIQSNLPLGIEQASSNSRLLPMMLAAVDRLEDIFENWINHIYNPELVRVRRAVLRISEAIIAPISEDVELHVVLGNQNGIIPLRGLGNFFIVESSYLQSQDLQRINPLGHEIGHIIFDLYARNEERAKYLTKKMVSTLVKVAGDMNQEKIIRSGVCLSSSWLNELVADVVSLFNLGPEVVIRDFEDIKKQGRPMLLGTDSHPPNALRIRFMRDKCLKGVGRDPKMSSFIDGLRKLKLSTNYEVADDAFFQEAMKGQKYNKDVLKKMPHSVVDSKIAFHSQTLNTLSELVDEILRWGNITSKIDKIRNAYTTIMQGGIPECDSATLYGAYLSAIRKKTEIDYLDLESRVM